MELDNKLKDKIQRVKLLILDVDGVLTDGKIIYSSFGHDIKEFDVKDGFGITLLYRAGIRSVILSARSSRTIRKRAKDMHVDAVYENAHIKLDAYNKILQKYKLTCEETAFIGDDLVDLPVLSRVGFSACTACAVKDLKDKVDYVTNHDGGSGAVRELAETILQIQGLWKSVTERYFK